MILIIHIRRRKNNCPHLQEEALNYFAEQVWINRSLSTLALDARKISETLSTVEKKYKTSFKHLNTDDDVPFATMVSSNPLISPYKDDRGRRWGVSQRNHWDTVVLTEINSGLAEHDLDIGVDVK